MVCSEDSTPPYLLLIVVGIRANIFLWPENVYFMIEKKPIKQ